MFQLIGDERDVTAKAVLDPRSNSELRKKFLERTILGQLTKFEYGL